MSDPKYFAADEAEKCAASLMNKSKSFYNTLASNFYLEKLRKMWRFYHGLFYDGAGGAAHQINFMGEQGELTHLPVNHFRNLAQHMIVMITTNRPVMEARAVNTDYKSLAQTYLANGILDYYMKEKNLEDYLKRACEMAVVLGAGYIKMEWNATSGEAYDVDDEGNFNYEGELEFSNLSPFDVVFDGTKDSWSNDWLLTRSFKNKYDLIAKYPEYAEKINSLPTKANYNTYRLALWSNDDTDDIPVFEFYHKRTEALPEGRYMLFLSDDIVLIDTKLPYRTVPIFRIAAGEFMGTPYAYTSMFDVFPIQEGINSLYSTVLTNQNAFGVQNIWVPPGADLITGNLGGGLNIIQSEQKPEALNLTQTPAEIFKFLEMLIQSAETISGVNSVARGNPQASLESGAALALVQSMALQFISGLQQSYVKIIEDVGTGLINILKDFAKTPKVVALVGKNNRPLLKEFTGEDINSINRVIVDVGNPLSRTTAGRVQMAEQLAQMKLIKNPQQYFNVINTGRLDMTFEGEVNELLLVKSENERLMDGEDVLVAPTDDHRLHISEHRAVVADPDLRKNPELVRVVMDHMQGHLDALRNVDPDLLLLLGQQPLPPAGQTVSVGQPISNTPLDNQDVLAGSAIGGVMAPQDGMPQAGDLIQQGGASEQMPAIPTVDPSLLPNPDLQMGSLDNLK